MIFRALSRDFSFWEMKKKKFFSIIFFWKLRFLASQHCSCFQELTKGHEQKKILSSSFFCETVEGGGGGGGEKYFLFYSFISLNKIWLIFIFGCKNFFLSSFLLSNLIDWFFLPIFFFHFVSLTLYFIM